MAQESARNIVVSVNPFTYRPPLTPPPGSSGLTRIQYEMMDQRISQAVLSELTNIPKPTISQYANGVRHISTRHLPILALALGVTPPIQLRGYVDENLVFVIEDEWCDENPFYYRRRFTTRSQYMDPSEPIRRHSVSHKR